MVLHGCMVHAQNRILKILLSLEIIDDYPVLPCLLAVDAKAVRLVALVIGKGVGRLFRSFCLVLAIHEHVLRQPLLDKSLCKRLPSFALLNKSWPILLEDR